MNIISNLQQKGPDLGRGFYEAKYKWCNEEWSRGHPKDMKIHLVRNCESVPNNIKAFWRENFLKKVSGSNTKSKNQKTIRIEKKIELELEKEKYLTITVVTDNGANLRVAQHITHEKYPYILDLRCIAHAINLIASDFAEIDLIKNIISNCGSIIEFFNNSYTAHGYYKEQLHKKVEKYNLIVKQGILDNHPEVITNRNVLSLLQDEEFYFKYYQIASILKLVKEMTNILESRTANLTDCFIGLVRLGAKINQIRNINLWKSIIISNYNCCLKEFINNIYILAYWLHPLYREIQSYCKTRCNALYNTTDSLVRSKPILDNHPEVITNRNVLSLLQDEEFYFKYYQIASILKLVKEMTNILESRTANLTDCFIGLVRLGAKINQIRNINLWKSIIISNYNCCLKEFINNIYILAYWLHPLYRETLMKWWLSINVENDETDQLQELALLLFSIIESMAKIRSYYILNSEKELKFYDKNISKNELYKNIDESVIIYNAFKDGILENKNLKILEKNENLKKNKNLNENEELENNLNEENENNELVSLTSLDLSQFVDLTLPEFLSSDLKEVINSNMEYDPITLAILADYKN
ncbi:hypothetical protein Glove_19g119 [Diversispora epigaea]|uniref:DUF659 domain-containing protein n=1 Tax=Diversispora epigaea TaxID=1348612 RepID=A0A397JUS6_9GLOM|nr:hypothetical protein Glove_19g119 [Diversispora epigaea]